MRITGTLHTVGTIHICENYRADAPVELTEIQGILISTGDKETHEAMCNLLSSTVDIYPHPVNGLVAGECTPENYAHALARLAHAEDHLAREVRSSQALTMLHTNMCAIADRAATEANDLHTEVKRLRRVLHKHGISADTSGEEYDDGPDERGRDENGDALA
jgi:CRISPR/Cas system-associated endonuclease Cas1